MHISFSVSIAALLLPAAALAQSPTRTEPRPDPLDGKASVAPLVYRSAFTDYRSLAAESPALGWREANEGVERIGGWRAYAREANAPAASNATPAASSPAPAASAPAPAPAARPRASRPATPQPGHRH
jgi:hypothetical protein